MKNHILITVICDQNSNFRKLKMIERRHFEKRYRNILVTPRCDKVRINE